MQKMTTFKLPVYLLTLAATISFAAEPDFGEGSGMGGTGHQPQQNLEGEHLPDVALPDIDSIPDIDLIPNDVLDFETGASEAPFDFEINDDVPTE